MMEPYGSLPTPLRSGFIFGGWWTEPNSESYAVSKAMKRESGSLVPYIPDQTLYAHWLVKVTYDAGGIAPATVFVPADGTNGSGRYKISAKVPERKGHAFKGWADDSGRLYQPVRRSRALAQTLRCGRSGRRSSTPCGFGQSRGAPCITATARWPRRAK